MAVPVDDKSLLGDLVPNVYIKRITLDYNAKTTKFRGSNAHYSIPTKEQFNAGALLDQQSGTPNIDPLSGAPLSGLNFGGGGLVTYESINSGLYGSNRPYSIPFSSKHARLYECKSRLGC